MDMIADRVWAARERGFVEQVDGGPLIQARTIAHLGLLRAAGRRRSWRTVAAMAALAGSVLTRLGWIAVVCPPRRPPPPCRSNP